MHLCVQDQTIIAQATPSGPGAIALLRISGPDAFAIVQKISKLPGNKQIINAQSHTIQFGWIVNDQTIIDQVLFLVMRAPKTFTGQDTIEITCHNNQFIIQEIISLAIHSGARLAQEGEFTKRAVLNGKMDLIQAEAINELIHAQTQVVLKKSLSQLEGSFSYWTNHLQTELTKALALCQASFEFLDEEMEFAPQIKNIIQSVKSTIAEIKVTFNQQKQIRQGIRIALIGAVNAGKSSLFNALVKEDKAIVNAQAGTTRDAIEAGLYKNGNYWTMVDTAGIRQTTDSIEKEGIKRSISQAHKADIILLAYDSSRVLSDEEKEFYQKLCTDYPQKTIIVYTKADLCKITIDEHAIAVSSKNGTNIPQLEEAIEQKIKTLFESIESPFLLNQRQYQLLLALEMKLGEVVHLLEKKMVDYEILAIYLQDAIELICELTGKTISEAGMDMVFQEFCVGK